MGNHDYTGPALARQLRVSIEDLVQVVA